MESNNDRDQVKIKFKNFTLEMSGKFVQKNGRIFAYGAVACGLVIATGATYGVVYTLTRNGEVAKEIAGKVAQLKPKLI